MRKGERKRKEKNVWRFSGLWKPVCESCVGLIKLHWIFNQDFRPSTVFLFFLPLSCLTNDCYILDDLTDEFVNGKSEKGTIKDSTNCTIT